MHVACVGCPLIADYSVNGQGPHLNLDLNLEENKISNNTIIIFV